MARGFPIMRQPSCSRGYERSLRAETGGGSLPGEKQSGRPNKRISYDKGGSICNDAPAFYPWRDKLKLPS